MNNEDIQRSLGRIEAQIELILKQMSNHQEERKLLADKVNKIETKINYAAGTFAGVTLLLGIMIDPLLRKLGIR